MRSEADIRAALHAFVQRHANDFPLTDDTPLFTLRVLRSVHLPELILLLERLRAGPIDVEQLQPGDFASIDVIVRRFGAVS
ncbi:hypothetical protein [Allorhizocola rhizosphaerae]|uniref:hypothetical protein n=1 Tax=Allorhizocola rhizosphaerae TaxID=1872709 RepID=UPI000E3BD2A0|nr:hypothetical protein [Allorhizocola rhizosphaerae]